MSAKIIAVDELATRARNCIPRECSREIGSLFVNYPSNKLLYSGNTAPFGGVILGSNPSGVASSNSL